MATDQYFNSWMRRLIYFAKYQKKQPLQDCLLIGSKFKLTR